MSSPAWSWRHAILAAPLPAMTKFVLLVISCFMNDLGEGCYRATRDLARFCSLSERSVCTHIENAVQAGWLRKSQHGFRGQRWKRHHYEPLWPAQGAEPSSAPLRKALNLTQQGAEADGEKVLNEVQRDKYISESLSPSSPGVLAQDGEAFHKFWQAWPIECRPRARPQAAKLFAQLTPADRQQAAQFAHAYRSTQGQASGFAPMLPYLRQRLFTEFADAPAIDGGHFVITPDRPEWPLWLAHLQTVHSPSVVERQAVKGQFLTPTRWPPKTAETTSSISPPDKRSPFNDRASTRAGQ